MNQEIERKFLVKELPKFDNPPLQYERYYIYTGTDIEVRVQKKGEVYEFERKVKKSYLTRENTKFKITKGEFEAYKKLSKKSIIRESYLIKKEDPNITVKVYKGCYEGLNRVEVEFKSEDEAKSFIPLSWFGKEITNTQLGKDSKLITLSKDDFYTTIMSYRD